MMIRILLLTRYSRIGASSRVRFYQYLPYLEEHGIEVAVSPLFNQTYLEKLYGYGTRDKSNVFRAYVLRMKSLINCSKLYNLLWIEKELFPGVPFLIEFLLALRNVSYVVDYDDAIFHNYDKHPNPILRNIFATKISNIMKNASLTIAGNEYLASHARDAGANVTILPTVVDLTKYHSSKIYLSSNKFSIGWIGSPSSAKFLNLIKPALTEICKNGQTKLILIGCNKYDWDDLPVEIRPWSEESEAIDINSIDVGIMPLVDGPWERGKCGYKLLQYMACSKPVVASPVGVNCDIVENGANGFLAKTNQEWLQALVALRDNPTMRKVFGQNGRTKVENEYCLQVTEPLVENIIRRVVCTQNKKRVDN